MEKRFIDVKGTQVMDLTPDLERPLALVDLNTIKRLVKFLPSAGGYEIINEFRSELRGKDLEEGVLIAEEFVAFHKTVNFLKEINKEDIDAETTTTFNEH